MKPFAGALPGLCRGVDVPGLSHSGDGLAFSHRNTNLNCQSWNEIFSHQREKSWLISGSYLKMMQCVVVNINSPGVQLGLLFVFICLKVRGEAEFLKCGSFKFTPPPAGMDRGFVSAAPRRRTQSCRFLGSFTRTCNFTWTWRQKQRSWENAVSQL